MPKKKERYKYLKKEAYHQQGKGKFPKVNELYLDVNLSDIRTTSISFPDMLAKQ